MSRSATRQISAVALVALLLAPLGLAVDGGPMLSDGAPLEPAVPPGVAAADVLDRARATPLTLAGALDLAGYVLDNRESLAGRPAGSSEALRAQRAQLGIPAAGVDHAGALTLADVVEIVQTATDAQAAALGVAPTDPVVVPHGSPSAAILALLAAHQTVAPPHEAQKIQQLDMMSEPLRSDFTAFVDAFIAYEASAQRLHDALQQAGGDRLTWNDDYGALWGARNAYLEGVLGVATTLASTPSAAVGFGVINVPDVIFLDFDAGATTYNQDYALVFDVGGADTYNNNAGGADGTTRAGAALVDLAGNDRYVSGRAGGVNGGGYRAAGFLLDAAGDDTYVGAGYGVNGGGALGGVGLLVDAGGVDSYSATSNGVNGGGDGGDGFLFDAGGVDGYVGLFNGVNGGAANQGTGILIDMSGSDSYTARGFGANGGAYNDGRGVLFDGAGSDRYVGEMNGVNGGATWRGIGLLVDAEGDDVYEATRDATNGGASETAVGFLLDLRGRDFYNATSAATNGGGLRAGYGHVVDLADDDRYVAGSLATNGGGYDAGAGFLLDLSDNDVYAAGASGVNGGTGGPTCTPEGEIQPGPCAGATRAAGFLLDGGGTDTYTEDAEGTRSDAAANNQAKGGPGGALLDASVARWNPVAWSAAVPFTVLVGHQGEVPTVGTSGVVNVTVATHAHLDTVALTIDAPASALLVDGLDEPGTTGLPAGSVWRTSFRVTPLQADGMHVVTVTANAVSNGAPFAASQAMRYVLGSSSPSSVNTVQPVPASAAAASGTSQPAWREVRDNPLIFLHGIYMTSWWAPRFDLEDLEGPVVAMRQQGWGAANWQTPRVGYYHCDSNYDWSVDAFGRTSGPAGNDVHAYGVGNPPQPDRATARRAAHQYAEPDPAEANSGFEDCPRSHPHGLDTPIEHLAYHFAWAVYEQYQRAGGPMMIPAAPTCVNVVAHSMGGLITRFALQAVEAQDEDFPPVLCIDGVLTMGTPHDGYTTITGMTDFFVGSTQFYQMEPGSAFLGSIARNQHPVGRDLDGSLHATKWIVMGSWADDIVGPWRAIANIEGDLEVEYDSSSDIGHSVNGWWDHYAASPIASASWDSDRGYVDPRSSERVPEPVIWGDYELSGSRWACSDSAAEPFPIEDDRTRTGDVFRPSPDRCHFVVRLGDDVTRTIIRERSPPGVDRNVEVRRSTGGVALRCATSSPNENCEVGDPVDVPVRNALGDLVFSVENAPGLNADQKRAPFTVHVELVREADCGTRGDAKDNFGAAKRISYPLPSSGYACVGTFPAGTSDTEDWYRFDGVPGLPLKFDITFDARWELRACIVLASNPNQCYEAGYVTRDTTVSHGLLHVRYPYSGGLTAADASDMRLRVWGAAGTGASYLLTSPPDRPLAPRTTRGDGFVDLWWDAPASTGGSAITEHCLYRGTSAGTETLVSCRSASLAQPWRSSGLTNGVTYSFRVSAKNVVGEGPSSVSVTGRPARAPSAPGTPTIVDGDASVTLSWTAPTSDGGEAITGYRLYRGTTSGGQVFIRDLPPTTTAQDPTNAGDPPLSNGATYYYKVSAVTAPDVPEGPRSGEAIGRPARVPDAPTLTGVAGTGQNSLTVTRPANNGGSTVTDLRIYRGSPTCSSVALVQTFTNPGASPLGWTDTGRSNGVDYCYQARAVNRMGEGASSPSVTLRPATVPSAPVVSLSRGDGSITATWTSGGDGGGAIQRYRVFVGTSSGGEIWEADRDQTTTPPQPRSYTKTGLVPGQNYFFQVSAVNWVGEGPRSVEQSARAAVKPDAPTLRVAAGGTTANLLANPGFESGVTNWTAVGAPGSGCVGANTLVGPISGTASYQITDPSAPAVCGVYQSWATTAGTYTANATFDVTSGTPQLLLDFWTACSETATMLERSSATVPTTGRHTLSVWGVAPPGTQCLRVWAYSGDANAGTFKVDDFALTAAANAPGRLWLGWRAPASDGADPITQYKLYRGTAAGSTSFLRNLGSVPGTSVDAGLTDGTRYFYEVTAVNAIGEGARSVVADGMSVGVPGAPALPSAVGGNNVVTLAWGTAAGNGDPPSRYHVERAASASGPFSALGTAATRAFTDATALNGNVYWYRVAAENLAGRGPNTSPFSAATAPGAPPGLVATARNAAVDLSWQAATGSPTSYHVWRSSGGSPFAEIGTSTGLTWRDTAVTNGVTYSYQVRGANAAGQGTPSVTVAATPQPPPAAPTGLATAPQGGAVLLTWNAVAGATQYRVYRGTPGTCPTQIATVTSASHTDTTAQMGVTYGYCVSAENSFGEGPKSSPPVEGAGCRAPSAPRNLVVDAVGADWVDLDWDAESDTGGCATDYNVYKATSSGGPWTITETSGNTAETARNLDEGRTYWFRVTAVNDAAEGPPSNTVTATPQRTVPSAPTSFSLTSQDRGARVSWSAPTDDGGAPISQYRVYRATSSSGTFTLVGSPTASPWTNTGITNGQTYFYKVSAVNSVGEGPQTSALSVMPQFSGCSLQADASNTASGAFTMAHDRRCGESIASGDTDWYKINAGKGKVLRVRLEDVSSSLDVDFCIALSGTCQVTQAGAGPGGIEERWHWLTSTGDWQIKVTRASGSGTYTLWTTVVDNDMGTGADAPSTASSTNPVIGTNPWASGGLPSGDTRDHFRINVASSRTVTVELTPQSGSNFDLFVFGPNSAATPACSSITGGSGGIERCTFSSGSGGWFIISVRDSATPTTGKYDLRVTGM